MLLAIGCIVILMSGCLCQDQPYDPDFVLDFFCTELSHHRCDFPPQKVCDSDGRTHQNLCEFQKTRCVFRHINFVDFGPCVATSGSR